MTDQPPSAPDMTDWIAIIVAVVGSFAAWVRAGKANEIAANNRLTAQAALAEAKRANRTSLAANKIAENAAAAAAESVVEAARSADTAERVEARQSRPYVFAQLKPGLAGLGTWDLVLSNSGKSNARNLTIECPELPDEDDDITGPLRRFFSGGQTLPPGATLRTYWSITPPKGGSFKDGTRATVGMPKRATLTVSYTSDDPIHPAYVDSFTIDEDTIGLTPAPADGHVVPDNLEPGEKNLHKMLAAIARNIGEGNR